MIENIRKILYFIIGVVVAYLLYKSYSYFNVSSRVQQIIPYNKNVKWDKIPDCHYDEKFKDAIVADFFYCSSANTPFVSNLKFDYLDLKVIKKTLMAGCRFLEFTVVPNDLSDHPTPMVSRTIKNDEIQSNINSLQFDDVCYTVKKYAFQSYEDNNNNLNENRYPLFIYLNIMSDNIDFFNDIGTIINNIWGNRLLDTEYHYENNDLAHVNICELFGKIVIITDNDTDRFMGSLYDNVINYNKIKRLHYNQLFTYNILEEAKAKGFDTPSYEQIIDNPNNISFKDLSIPPEDMGKLILETPDHLVEYTKNNLVIMYPNTEDDIEMTNHDFRMAITFGCQFISMNYQLNDEYLKEYVKIFEKKPLILKSKSIRLERTKIKKNIKYEKIIPKQTLNIISKPELMFRDIAIAIIPYIRSDVYAKYDPNTRKLVSRKMPKPTPDNEFNPYGFSESDIYIVKPSMANIKNAICFKSVNYPNRYLINSDGIIQLMSDDKTDRFRQKSSFYLVNAGEDNSVNYYQIVSATDTEYYIRIIDDEYRLDKYKGERAFGDEVKFKFEVTKINQYVSFRDYKGRYLRILDGGYLTCNINRIDTSAKFKLYKLLQNNYAILASNNKFLEYDNIGSVSATSPEMQTLSTKFQIKKYGSELYQIITYIDPKQKTIYPTDNGTIKMRYDGNILPDGTRTAKLGQPKYFTLRYSYGIDRVEKDINF